MLPSKPRLFDVPVRMLPFLDCPKGRHERASSFVDGHGMEADFDMVAEAGIVKSERHESNITRQRCQSDPSRNAVRADGIPNAEAFDPIVGMQPAFVARRLQVTIA